MTEICANQQSTGVTKRRGLVFHRFLPLLLVSILAAVAYGLVWIANPSGQEAGRGPWRAIGAIDSRDIPDGQGDCVLLSRRSLASRPRRRHHDSADEGARF